MPKMTAAFFGRYPNGRYDSFITGEEVKICKFREKKIAFLTFYRSRRDCQKVQKFDSYLWSDKISDRGTNAMKL
jgi:hypothetical protein